MRALAFAICLSVAAAALAQTAPEARLTREQALARADAVLARAPVIDGHNDLAIALRSEAGGDVTKVPGFPRERAHGQTDLRRLLAGRVGGQLWSVFIPGDTQDAARMQLEQIELMRRLIASEPAHLVLARDANELEAALRAGKIGGVLAMEGGYGLEGSLALLRIYYDLGVRSLGLIHDAPLDWADSQALPPQHGGLTPFGIYRIVLGALVGVSTIVALSVLWARLVGERSALLGWNRPLSLQLAGIFSTAVLWGSALSLASELAPGDFAFLDLAVRALPIRHTAQSLATTFVDSTHLTALIPSRSILTTDTMWVTVNTPGLGESNGKDLDVLLPIGPILNSLSPASASVGSGGFSLIVDGSGFVTGDIVRWNGADRPTTFDSPTRLIAAIPASDLANSGTVPITVFQNGTTSQPLQFSVTDFRIVLPPATSKTIVAGGSAVFDFQIESQHGSFDRMVQFGCTGLPAAAQCVFSTPSLMPTGTASNVQLTIRTTARSSGSAPAGRIA